MNKKIRWKREENGTAVPYVQQDGRWIRYNASDIAQPDDPRFSAGYKTFLFALKLGYEILELS